jgi:hypothetical protein
MGLLIVGASVAVLVGRLVVVRRRVSGLTVTAEMRRYVRGEHANTVDTHHHFG